MIERHDLDQSHLPGFGQEVVRLRCKDEHERQQQGRYRDRSKARQKFRFEPSFARVG